MGVCQCETQLAANLREPGGGASIDVKGKLIKAKQV